MASKMNYSNDISIARRLHHKLEEMKAIMLEAENTALLFGKKTKTNEILTQLEEQISSHYLAECCGEGCGDIDEEPTCSYHIHREWLGSTLSASIMYEHITKEGMVDWNPTEKTITPTGYVGISPEDVAKDVVEDKEKTKETQALIDELTPILAEAPKLDHPRISGFELCFKDSKVTISSIRKYKNGPSTEKYRERLIEGGFTSDDSSTKADRKRKRDE